MTGSSKSKGRHSVSQAIPSLPGAHQSVRTEALCRELPIDCVLAAAASYNQNFHRISVKRPGTNGAVRRSTIDSISQVPVVAMLGLLGAFKDDFIGKNALGLRPHLAVLGTAVPWLGRRRVRQLMQMPETTKQDRLLLYASTIAFQWLAAGVILWRAGARGIALRLLGLQIPNVGVVALVSASLAALVS